MGSIASNYSWLHGSRHERAESYDLYQFVPFLYLPTIKRKTPVRQQLTYIQAGVWRFSYPITITFGQVLATHVCFMIWILLTRLFHQPLSWLGLENLIAPPVRKLVSPGGLLTLGACDMSLLQTLQILPLAIVFVAKLFFGNLSFAYVFPNPAASTIRSY